MTSHFGLLRSPLLFGLCAAENCPKPFNLPAPDCHAICACHRIFLPTVNPNRIIAGKGKCDYYCSNEKTRFALGFTRTANALTVRMASTFRYRMISCFGRKNYYLKHREH